MYEYFDNWEDEFDSSELYEETNHKKADKVEDLLKKILVPIAPTDNEQFEELDFILPGLCRGDVGILAGSGGTGKSYLSMELGYSIAYGTKFFNADGSQYFCKDKPKRVKILNFEDRKENVKNRLIAIRNFAKKQRYIAGGCDGWDRMGVFCVHKYVMELKIMDYHGKVNKSVLEIYKKICQDTDLLIIDPLAQIHSADENNNSQMSMLMSVLGNIAEETQTAILLVHHTNKSSVSSGTASAQQAARGASAIVDASRLTMTLLRVPALTKGQEVRKSGAKEGDLELWFPKINAHAPISEIALIRNPGGVLSRKSDQETKYSQEVVENENKNGKSELPSY